MRIFHIATVADWDAARAGGGYTTSTRGRTLAEEGFIHASRGDQWQGVRDRFYADVTEPLVLLVIDTDRLTSPVVEEPVADSAETFPHVYGPIDVDAVVQTIPLSEPEATTAPQPAHTPAPAVVTEPGPSFSRLYLQEMFRNVVVAIVVMVTAIAGAWIGQAIEDEWGPFVGAIVGLGVGVLVGRRVVRRRPGATPA